MGYSSTDGASGKGLGQFTDTASTQSDLNKLIELLASRANVREGNQAARDAITGASLFSGLGFIRDDAEVFEAYFAGVWKRFFPIHAIAAGEVTHNTDIPNGAVSSAMPVTFPAGRFSQAPLVFTATENSRLVVEANSKTTSGCELRARNASGATALGPIDIGWVAIQMTSGSASG